MGGGEEKRRGGRESGFSLRLAVGFWVGHAVMFEVVGLADGSAVGLPWGSRWGSVSDRRWGSGLGMPLSLRWLGWRLG